MTERFHTIDGETLMSQPLTPISFVVDSLLSQGLHILAGAPKCGKSLACTVAVSNSRKGRGGLGQQGSAGHYPLPLL